MDTSEDYGDLTTWIHSFGVGMRTGTFGKIREHVCKRPPARSIRSTAAFSFFSSSSRRRGTSTIDTNYMELQLLLSASLIGFCIRPWAKKLWAALHQKYSKRESWQSYCFVMYTISYRKDAWFGFIHTMTYDALWLSFVHRFLFSGVRVFLWIDWGRHFFWSWWPLSLTQVD